MRLLLLHCDFIEYEPIEKEIDLAEADIQKTMVRIENLIVALTSIERQLKILKNTQDRLNVKIY
jgi:threonyl-tRNA synthetase